MELRSYTVVPSNHATGQGQDLGVSDNILPGGSINERQREKPLDLTFWNPGKPQRQTSTDSPFAQSSVAPCVESVPSQLCPRIPKWHSQGVRSKEKEARELFHELSKCEEFQKYRQRQPRSGSGSKCSTWPDNLEEAFFLGRRATY
jgi:hypothetical protein